MQSPIAAACFREWGTRFLRPLVDLVRPRAIAALGTGALDGVLGAFGIRRNAGLIELIERRETYDLPNGGRVFPLCHPSPTVMNVMRSMERQKEDWRRVGEWLRPG